MYFPLSYERVIVRDCVRFMCTCEHINQSPLGSATLTDTPFDVNHELTANLLGFGYAIRNSIDASATRDFLTETLSALITHTATLSGPTADLVILSSKGLIELSDNYSSTSSIMPQKKSPDTMELVRAVMGDTVGEPTGLLATLRGLPRAYNRDLQRAHKHTSRTVDDVGEAAVAVAGAVASATWPEDGLAAAAGDSFSTATGVTDLLAMAGLPFRIVHEVVAEAAARSEGTSDAATLDAVVTDVLSESLFTHVTAETIGTALDPTKSAVSRDSVGGPVPAAVEATLSAAHDELSDDAAAAADVRDSLAAAAGGLDEEVSSYV